MYVGLCVCTKVNVCFVRVCVYVHLCARVCTKMNVPFVRVCVYVHLCVCAYVRVYVCVQRWRVNPEKTRRLPKSTFVRVCVKRECVKYECLSVCV